MALLQDLIQQIDDKALRERILQETNKLMKQKKFGLVFEEHLPDIKEYLKQTKTVLLTQDAFDELVKKASAQPEQPPEIQDILNYLDTVLHPIVSPEHWDVYAELHDMISTLPSAEPERKKGKWIEVNDFYNRIRGRCSVCGWDAHILKVMVRTEVEIVGN